MTTLGTLIVAAIHDPENADTAGLLREAANFLKIAEGGNPDLLWLGRDLARAAEDFAFLQSDESLCALRQSARAYSMASQAINP